MGFHALCLLHLNKFKNFRFYKYQLQILQFGHQISRWNRASVCVYIWVVFGSLVGSCQLFCGESSHLHELFSKTVKKTWNNDDLKGFFSPFFEIFFKQVENFARFWTSQLKILKDAAKFYFYVKKWLNLVVYGSHSLNIRSLKEDKKETKEKQQRSWSYSLDFPVKYLMLWAWIKFCSWKSK